MGNYLYSDLIADFRSTMRDPSTLNNKFFTDAEILIWAADANMEMCREAGLFLFDTTLALVAGTAEYRYPNNALKIVRMVDSEGKRILPTTQDFLDQLDDDWADDSGDVDYYYPTKTKGSSSNKDIGFYRKPAAVQTITIKAWKLPQSSKVAVTAAPPEVDDAIVKLTMDYILAKGYEKKRDFSQRDMLIKKFYGADIPMAKRFFNIETDRIVAMGSNEGRSDIRMGRLPDGYPERSR